MSLPTVGQDPNAHVFYDVDWCKWLEALGFVAGDISSIVWSVPSPLVKTFQLLTLTVARVWIRAVPNNRNQHTITCTIVMPKPDVAAPEVTDDFSFIIRAIQK